MRIALLTAFLAVAAHPVFACIEPVGSLVDTLLARGQVNCRPALPNFCRNIHAGCSGRSTIATAPFSVELKGDIATLTYAPGKSQVADLPSSGPLEVSEDLSYALVRLRPEADYLRIEADGRYNIRIYRRGTAYMSRGVCE